MRKQRKLQLTPSKAAETLSLFLQFSHEEQDTMAKSVGSNNVGLLRSVQERALSKEDEQKKQLVPYLHGDFISDIFIWLPIESLQISMCVCKPWYNVINSPIFIDTHLCRSESVLIFQVLEPTKVLHQSLAPSSPAQDQNMFSVEGDSLQATSVAPLPLFWLPSAPRSKKYSVQFMEFSEGRSKIRDYKISCQGRIIAACNGLILLENKLKNGGLIVMNPVKRKMIALPVGTLSSPYKESHGFALSDAIGKYKVVHLFFDELRYVNCEILNLGTRTWREVNGPPFGILPSFGYPPIFVIGALHWLPYTHGSEYIVSLGIDDEIFYTRSLPKTCGIHDRIIEMGGSLSFITHEDLAIDIWSLKSLCGGDWIRQYRIVKGTILDMVPLMSSRISGDLIFRRQEGGSFYAYDFKLEKMVKVETNERTSAIYAAYPHVNSLVSWE